MLQEPGDELLIGTGWARHGGLCFWRGGLAGVWGRAEGLAGERVRSLYRDRVGRYWIGSEYDGVTVFTPGRGSTMEPDGRPCGQ